MRLWAVVPVKGGDQVKSRLAPVLSLEERRRLYRQALERVFEAIEGAQSVEGLIVVTSDGDGGLRGHKPARFVRDAGDGLNRAVEQGIEDAQAAGAEAAIVLPADLPLLLADDVDGIARLVDFERGVVIAPSRRRDGTNGLLVRPPPVFAPAFGPNSFERHLSRARGMGLSVRVYESSRIGLDLDTPADLADLERLAAERVGR